MGHCDIVGMGDLMGCGGILPLNGIGVFSAQGALRKVGGNIIYSPYHHFVVEIEKQ